MQFNPIIILIVRKLPNLIASFLRLKLTDALRGINVSNKYKKEVDSLYQNETNINIQIFIKLIKNFTKKLNVFNNKSLILNISQNFYFKY